MKALAAAWLVVLALFGGVVGWLFATAEETDTRIRLAAPRVVLPLPAGPEVAARPAPAEPFRPPTVAEAVAEAPEAVPPPSPPQPAALEPPEPEPVPGPVAETVAETVAEAEAPEAVPPPSPAEPPALEPPEPEPVPEPVAETMAEPVAEAVAEPEAPEAALIARLPELIGTELPAAEPIPGPETEAPAPVSPGQPAEPVVSALQESPSGEEAGSAAEVAQQAPTGRGEREVQVAALPPGGGLAPAPDPALIEHGRLGPLPVIGPDGREPWRVYARPFDDADERPRIAVVVIGLGWSAAATQTAIQQLPGEVTLAFSPYSGNLGQWINLARAAGHETLLHLPMEPVNYPVHDPGPYALLTSLDSAENTDRLEWLLSRFTGYVGVTNHMGSRFTNSAGDLKPILESLKSRGLMFVDSRSSATSLATKVARDVGLPRAHNNRFVDHEASRQAIDRRLAEIEEIARSTGFAVAIGSPYPVTMERLAAWLPKLERKGIAIAPITAVANRQDAK